MEATFNHIVFYVIAAVIVVFSIMAVVTKRVLRAATYLLFVLLATAGLYFQLNYNFLGAVQITIYAGGIIVLYVFSILLTQNPGDRYVPLKRGRVWMGLIASVSGLAICGYLTFTHVFTADRFTGAELDIRTIGHTLMGTEKYQYLLPFEALSVLLLACIIGGILIARKK